MKIALLVLTRNNEDIIDANLRYHKAMGVDSFFVTDNLSEDRTVAQVKKFASEADVTLLHERRDDCNGTEWVTRMARLAAEAGADWIIPTDADEFWWPTQGDLKTLFASLPQGTTVAQVERVNFLPPTESDAPFWRSQTVREVSSKNALGEPLPPKVAFRAHPKIVVAQGNHDVSGEGYSVSKVECDNALIFHFPLRSYQQFEDKIRLGGGALERSKTVPQGVAMTWRTLYQEYKAGRLREFYEKECQTEQQIRDGIANGTLVVDERLKDFLDKLGCRQPGPDSAFMAKARALVARLRSK